MRAGKSFKQEFTFEERLDESRDVISKYPDRVPVVVERYTKTDLPDLEKKNLIVSSTNFFHQFLSYKPFLMFPINFPLRRYLVPRDMPIGQFVHVLSSRLHLQPGSVVDSIYESFKDEDGFLYVCYSTEKTFG